jgi:hypothetical protein
MVEEQAVMLEEEVVEQVELEALHQEITLEEQVHQEQILQLLE